MALDALGGHRRAPETPRPGVIGWVRGSRPANSGKTYQPDRKGNLIMSNGNSLGNGASICLSPDLDPKTRTMAWIFRRLIARVP